MKKMILLIILVYILTYFGLGLFVKLVIEGSLSEVLVNRQFLTFFIFLGWFPAAIVGIFYQLDRKEREQTD